MSAKGGRCRRPGTPRAAPGQPTNPGPRRVMTIVGADYFETLRLPSHAGTRVHAARRAVGRWDAASSSSTSRPRASCSAPMDPVGQRVQFAARDKSAGIEVLRRSIGVVDRRAPRLVRPDAGRARLPGRPASTIAGELISTCAWRPAARPWSRRCSARCVRTIRAVDERVPVLELQTLRQQRDDNHAVGGEHRRAASSPCSAAWRCCSRSSASTA